MMALLIEWVRDMSRWIKQHDPNHLLAVGDEGFFGKHGVDCDALLQVPDIDFGTFHLYPQAWKQRDPLSFGLRWIEQHLWLRRKMQGEPMLLEEYGITVGGRRDFIHGQWLKTILEHDGAGAPPLVCFLRRENGEPHPP